MKQKAVLAFIVLVLYFMAQSAIAEEEKPGEESKKLYIGLGFSYAIPKMGTDQNRIDLSQMENTKGFNAKLGFTLKDDLFLEAEINNLQNFYWAESLYSGAIAAHVKLDILTVILSGKYLMPLDFWGVQPFVTAGAGGLYYSAENYYFEFGSSSLDYRHDFQPCIKVGLGAEYPISNTIAIAAEASYVKAFLRLDYVSYYNYGLNVLFYF